MERFEIEEIITQDKHGGLFRATDTQTGFHVAVLRFFPNGKNNDGLKQTEAAKFTEVSQVMATITHPSLTQIIDAGIDPLDSIPYVVYEWSEGTSLQDLLASNTLEPGFVIDLIRLSIQISSHVSESLGHEALWIDTDLSAIVLSSLESDTAIYFRLSPLRWIDSNRSTTDAASLADFVRRLMNWGTKKISDKEASGLGAWTAWLKLNPDANLAQSLESLVVMTRNAKAQTFGPQKPSLLTQKSRPSGRHRSDSKTTRNVLLCVIIPMTVACIVLFVVRKKKMESAPPLIAQQEVQPSSNPGSQLTPADQPAPASRKEEIKERSLELRKEIENSANESESEILRIKTEADARGGIFLPDDTPYARTLKVGNAFKLKGTLKRAGLSKSGNSLYLFFSSPFKQGQLRGVLYKKQYEGTYDIKAFDHLVGKTIILDGVIAKEPSTSPVLVKIMRISQISQE